AIIAAEIFVTFVVVVDAVSGGSWICCFRVGGQIHLPSFVFMVRSLCTVRWKPLTV
ncbi:hypothetical protein A2U01_0051131, partial [Trifolium medium]|nr:hypothetical protein [Trifolium medium]